MKKYCLAFDNKFEPSDCSINGFEIVEASQILNKEIQVDQEAHITRYGFELSQEEINIARAHIGLWHKFLLSGEEYCLIIEDSVSIETIEEKFFEDLHGSLEEDWCTCFPYNPLEKRTKNFNLNVRNLTPFEYYNDDPFFLGTEWGTYIYLLSKKGAKILLKEITTIFLRIDDMILSLNESDRISIFYGNVPFFDFNSIKVRSYQERNQKIRNAIENLNVWNEEDLKDCRSILKRMADKAEELNIKLILQGGSHLGYVRHGGIMPWDDDVDLGIFEGDLQVFLDNIEDAGLRYTKWVTGQKSNIEYYKLWIDNGRTIEGYPYCFPFVDLWVYDIKGSNLSFRGSIACPNSNNYELELINFEGAKLYTVGNSLEVLDSRYIDWRSTIRIYEWNHKLEKPCRKMLRIGIQVDYSGKFVTYCL